MTDLLTLHKYFLSQHLRRGGVAVDFTMGNGHDTQYLCNAVYGGEAAPGKVYAFDIQQAAVDSTARLLRESGTPENYTLICASHDRVAEFVHEPFDAGVFNLGWLPGSDKKVTTQRDRGGGVAARARRDTARRRLSRSRGGQARGRGYRRAAVAEEPI